MCGIVGVYSFDHQVKEYSSFLKWSLGTMVNRGPDDEGAWTDDQCYLAGFRRLSIRDLSHRANQPMVSSCGRYILNFNGEIYNTKYFCEILREKEVKFSTSSDTEILLYSLIHFDFKEVLALMDGIFAFAFYDNDRDILLLARDRAGVKPLYIGQSEDGLIYSSQYDHIVNCPFIRKKPMDGAAIGTYLQLGFMPAGSGIVSGTFLMPQGHYLKIEGKLTGSPKPFFEFPFSHNPETDSNLENVLADAVQHQLVSDVPIGTFLSGGVDSPLVAHFAGRFKPSLHSYSIGFEDVDFDESNNAAIYAKKFNTIHHLRQLSEEDLLKTLEDNTKAYSEPFADYSSVPTLVLSKLAREKLIVALSGDGGDELFWGYPRNQKVVSSFENITASKTLILFKILFQKILNKKRTVTSKELKYPDFVTYYYNSIFISGASHWVPKLMKTAPNEPKVFAESKHVWNNSSKDLKTASGIMRKLEFDLHLQRILLKVDRASMFHSLEVRVPLLSNEVIGKSLEYTFEDCIKEKQGKYPLKKMLVRLTGSEMAWEEKKGFGIPLGNWMRTSLKDEVQTRLMDMPDELRCFFNMDQVEIMLRQHMSGKKDWSWMIWAVFTLVNWHDFHYRKFEG